MERTHKSRLLIVDGHNLLFQMFFGMPSRIRNREGRAVQGVIGFIGAVRKLLTLVEPSHVLVLFDAPTHNERCDIFESYKANRPDYSIVCDDENPFTQLPDIYRALDALGICHTECEGCEADDVIASYALSLRDVCEVVISSYDSDFFQLIGENVRVLRYRGDCSVLCDEEYVRCRYGIPPSLYAHHKALVGDTADNIPGIQGIGPKTAARLLLEFGSLDALLTHKNEASPSRIRDALTNQQDELLRNLRLIALDGHAPLSFPLDTLSYTKFPFSTTELLRTTGTLP